MYRGTNNRAISFSREGIATIRKRPLTRMEHKALRHFEASLPTGGAAVYHVDLGAELEIPSTNLSVTMKRHCQVGFPLQGAKIGKHYHYKFNTQFFRIVSR